MVGMWWLSCLVLGLSAVAGPAKGSELLMITMGGTKSHKIPFWELARGMIARDHNVTFVSAFPADFQLPGLEEITPAGLVFYVRNYTNWDLVGAKMRGEEPVSVADALRYGHQSCEAFLEDPETIELLQSHKKFDLLILDGAFPECAFGLVHHFKVPFMYINTVAFYMQSISMAGSPAPYSVTPFFSQPHTDAMTFSERVTNTAWYLLMLGMHTTMVNIFMQPVMTRHFGEDFPRIYDFGKNVSFILQNGHHTVTYPRPYLPNVAEIACIHCKAAQPLSKDLEDFIMSGGGAGFVYVSMGSSVKAANMPEELRRLLVATFSRLPYQVLWKWEDDSRTMPDLPPNVKLSRWLPQQDLLGHRLIRAFVTHGGLLSMFESVYHGVPMLSLPVFCDHEANAAKAAEDGYALRLSLRGLTSPKLLAGILAVAKQPQYRQAARSRQVLLRDQENTPLQQAVYWTEYVLRHNGADHLRSPARNLTMIEYFSLDMIVLFGVGILLMFALLVWLFKSAVRSLRSFHGHPSKQKTQ